MHGKFNAIVAAESLVEALRQISKDPMQKIIVHMSVKAFIDELENDMAGAAKNSLKALLSMMAKL